jgi:DNA excision repair protein ERCC-2
MAVKIDLARKKVTLGVGDLLAAPVNGGRVAGIRPWTRLALGREAHEQHQAAQAAAHTGYAREVAIRYQTTVDEFAVTIQGRIDGVLPEGTVEEIKSVVLPPLAFGALTPAAYPHYVEQLRLYCFLLQQPEVKGRLVFINVAAGDRKGFEFAGPFDDCAQLIADRVRLLIGHAQTEQHRQEQRRAAAGTLLFPHGRPRKYQDRMIAAVERALAEGRHLLVSAPSGIGKTAAALFPAVKHVLAGGGRVFFVTAKNTQQALAMETLRRMGILPVPSSRTDGREAPPTITAVQFRAREKMCINDQYACREEFCHYLRDFSLKLEKARFAALMEPPALMDLGRQVRLCPFELALVAAEQADVVVSDYNYVFDPQVYFRRFFQDADYSDAVLVIDEAHNLVQRALDYYSPCLHRQPILQLRDNLRHVEPALADDLRRFLDEIDLFFRRQDATAKDVIPSPREFFDALKPTFHRLTVRYFLDKLTSGRVIPDDPVEAFFSDFGQFVNVLALDGDEFSCIFDPAGTLQILCKDASRQLAPRLAGFRSVIAMSATLTPMEFYRQMLGFDPDRTDALTLPSPFPRENRRVLVVPTVSTVYRQRNDASYRAIAGIIAQTAGAHAGNYMALFPSYEFLRAVAEQLCSSSAVTLSEAKGRGRAGEKTEILPHTTAASRQTRLRFAQNDNAGEWQLLAQSPAMTDADRQKFLDALKTTDPPKLVLAVQGGVFAEGVDYPGEQLSGVIVVSPALPQVSFERELMRQYYDSRYGKGFEFAYLYPGMNRVIQAVGRLIRTETDRGVAVLVCNRFRQPSYTALFPPDWFEETDEQVLPADFTTELREFWAAS